MDALGLVASPTNAPAAYAAATKDFRPPAASDFSLRGRPNKTSVIVLGAGIAAGAGALAVNSGATALDEDQPSAGICVGGGISRGPRPFST